MQTFLVGGAVRDELLGIPVVDHDWVVVGATHDEMLSNNFKQVGADFPVYLHPITREEYALARTERKNGKGYHGFTVSSAPSVTLEEDLLRRDLTINAIAKNEGGQYIDPYGGIPDIENKILRHVSDAFVEDPVRVLRLARFYARYYSYGFTIADETKQLVLQMQQSGELEHLVAERIWQECYKALGERHPEEFFYCLKELGVLSVLFPELAVLFEGEGDNVLRALSEAAKITSMRSVRFSVLCYALDPDVVDDFCHRLRTPNDFHKLAFKVAKWHRQLLQFSELEAEEILSLILGLDAIRNPEIVELFCDACEAIYEASDQREPTFSVHKKRFIEIVKSIRELEVASALKRVDRKDIPSVIHGLRIACINNLIKNQAMN